MNNKNWYSYEHILDSQMQRLTRPIDDNIQPFNNALRNKIIEILETISPYLNEDLTAVPENVIEFTQKGFAVDLNAMIPEKRYRFRFDGSRYEVWRNADDALELLELEHLNG